ncbi:MAG: type III-B CRISPR module RAMP protein Cmr6, partial [Candidatus Dadabacteria bacterium]
MATGKQKSVRFEIPRRAVPEYLRIALGEDSTPGSGGRLPDMPPGHRFLLYFPAMSMEGRAHYEEGDRGRRDALRRAEQRGDWAVLLKGPHEITAAWAPLKNGKRRALEEVAGSMGIVAGQLLDAIGRRQCTLASDDDWHADVELCAPLITGSGNPHPVENGFAFLAPYGVPYLAGSSLKGIMRRAAEELSLFSETPGSTGWTLSKVWALFGFDQNSAYFRADSPEVWRDSYFAWAGSIAESDDPVLGTWLDALRSSLPNEFRQTSATDFLRALAASEDLRRAIHWQGLLAFSDAFPHPQAKLGVDILNPHHRSYFQKGKSPHDADSPIPVFFLVIEPGARFRLQVRLLAGRQPVVESIGDWRALLDAAHQHITVWLGLGAKTAVGYGAVRPVAEPGGTSSSSSAGDRRARAAAAAEQAEKEAARKAAEAERRRQAELDALPPTQRLLRLTEEQIDCAAAEGAAPHAQTIETLRRYLKQLTDDAPSWSDPDERERAARLLERAY